MSQLSGPADMLLAHPDVWRADRIEPRSQGIGTGHHALDALLIDRGWPKAGLVEVLSGQIGIGEVRLLGPALAALSVDERRWIAWIDPPHVPYAPALAEIGVDLGKLLWVRPKSPEDALWATEHATKSGSCSAVLAWLDESKLTPKDIRRLKLATRRGESLTVLFRPDEAAQRQSMAELRILLKGTTKPDRLSVEIVKRRGGWPIEQLELPLSHRTTQISRFDLRERLTTWRSGHWRLRNLHRIDRPSVVPNSIGIGVSSHSNEPHRTPTQQV
jgi:cell division inhibitor SulA